MVVEQSPSSRTQIKTTRKEAPPITDFVPPPRFVKLRPRVPARRRGAALAYVLTAGWGVLVTLSVVLMFWIGHL